MLQAHVRPGSLSRIEVAKKVLIDLFVSGAVPKLEFLRGGVLLFEVSRYRGLFACRANRATCASTVVTHARQNMSARTVFLDCVQRRNAVSLYALRAPFT
nr:hypothetical protein [Caballeronia sp. EK]